MMNISGNELLLLVKNKLKEAQLCYEKVSQLNNHDAAILATTDANNQVNSRVVLIREINDNCLTFYTNYNSTKAREIDCNPMVSVVFYWSIMREQIRIKGRAVKSSDLRSDKYFDSRPYMSKILAWASRQSEVINEQQDLDQRIDYYQNKFPSDLVKRPDFWGGYDIFPIDIEFWQEGDHRNHIRRSYREIGNAGVFALQYLYP